MSISAMAAPPLYSHLNFRVLSSETIVNHGYRVGYFMNGVIC